MADCNELIIEFSIPHFFLSHLDGQWQLQEPVVVTLDQEPVTCLLPLGLTMYCACGSKIWVVDSLTAEVQVFFSVLIFLLLLILNFVIEMLLRD